MVCLALPLRLGAASSSGMSSPSSSPKVSASATGRGRRGVPWPFDEAWGALLGGSDVARRAGDDERPSMSIVVGVVVGDARLRSQRQNSLDTRVPALNSPHTRDGAS